jgi:hypothetical protein
MQSFSEGGNFAFAASTDDARDRRRRRKFAVISLFRADVSLFGKREFPDPFPQGIGR